MSSFLTSCISLKQNHIRNRIRRCCSWPNRSLINDENGQVVILFALMLMPILVAIGATVDYSRRNSAKSQLDAALDSSILAAVTRKSNSIPAVLLSSVEAQFRAEAAKIPNVKITSFLPKATASITSVNLAASYTATIDTTIGRVAGVSALSISGMAAGTRDIFKYIDFYLLLDNSPSMGLAATDADVIKMQNATTDKCAFACHQHTFDSSGNVTGDKMDDYYHVAKNENIRLRIDVLRDSVSNLVDTAKNTMKLSQQYRMEVWTFNSIQAQISSLTSYLDQTKSDSSKIDLAYSLYGDPDNQTSYDPAFRKMSAVIPASGDGLSSDSPVRFLFFVTDGVQDAVAGDVMSAGREGQFPNGNRFIGPFNPLNCDTLKSKNVRIGIIYTTYLPIYSNDFYNQYVKPYETKISSNLRSCATDGLFFPVATGGDINKAMQKLFENAVNSVRLTN